MRVPVSWLRELVPYPESVSSRQLADRLISLGLEVETVDEVGVEISGPLVLGRVLTFAEEEHSNGKTIRWCRVDVGTEHNEPASDDVPAGRGVVCGARNFKVDDLVVVALPGTTLPGGFAIGARKTYGHVSDGMICSTRELGVGDDHDGIWILPPETGQPGDDAVHTLSLRDDVLDIAVTPDRGYCLSIRGVARETAMAFDLPFVDPAVITLPEEEGEGWPVVVEDFGGCDRFTTRGVAGFNPDALSPLWMQRRLSLAGMRPISLAVDVTNYVMLELGQPLHAYDRNRLQGPIVVRRATAGETMTTLDGAHRTLAPSDLLITDNSGAIGVAGVMGGASTEISATSTDIVIEAAHFDPDTISRSAKLHRAPSEASRRFARGVDTQLAEFAAERTAALLVKYGAATLLPGRTVVEQPSVQQAIPFDPSLPSRLVGCEYAPADVTTTLTRIGCQVAPQPSVGETHHGVLVTPPSWRPDLTLPADLVEEVARVAGYEQIPSVLPHAPAGEGLTENQRLRRRIGLALAGAGFVEVLCYPFLNPQVYDDLALPADDPRRNALRIANPLSDEEPELRTTLLPGLLATLRRNVGRGFEDVALFEVGTVFRPAIGEQRGGRAEPSQVPRPSVAHRPSNDELAELDALLPHQPLRVAAVLAGAREPGGWWGNARESQWSDAIEAAQIVAGTAHVELGVSADDHSPWHPGRCAALRLGNTVVGHAGELHPRVIAALGLPARTCAMEVDVNLVVDNAPRVATVAPLISPYPVAKEDVALVVADSVPTAQVAEALRDGGGELLESVRLFDVFVGEQVGVGKRSLAFSLRLRAPDRTLTPEEVVATREAAVAEAGRRTGAVLRS